MEHVPQPLKWIFSKLLTMRNILMTHVNNCTTGFVKGNDVFFYFSFFFLRKIKRMIFFNHSAQQRQKDTYANLW